MIWRGSALNKRLDTEPLKELSTDYRRLTLKRFFQQSKVVNSGIKRFGTIPTEFYVTLSL